MSAYLGALWRGTADAPSVDASASDKEAAAVRELAARLEETDVEALLRRGGEAGLAPRGLGTPTLRRWLVAEKWDVDAAYDRLVTHAQWRADYVPRGFISEDEVADELACGKCFMQGTTGPDAAGRPLLVVLVARHSKSAADAATLKRFVCWCLDTAAHSGEKMAGLFDFRGVTMDCLDIVALRQIFGMLQTHFPERLDRVVMYAAPRLFNALWRVLTPFLDAKTKSKIVFVGEGGALDALPDFPLSVLPREYGGTADKIPIDVAAAAVRKRAGMAASRPPSGASAASVSTTMGGGGGGPAGAVGTPQDDDDDTMCEAAEVAALEAAVAAQVEAEEGDGGGLGCGAILCT